MSHKVSFIIPGLAVPKARPRTKTVIKTNRFGQIVEKRTWGYTPRASSDFERKAKLILQNEYSKNNLQPIPYPQPVKVTLDFILKRQATATPDIANLIVQLLDTLEGIAYENDSQVVEVCAIQKKGKYPMTEVTVEEG